MTDNENKDGKALSEQELDQVVGGDDYPFQKKASSYTGSWKATV